MRPRRTEDFHGLLHAITGARRIARLARHGQPCLHHELLTADGERWESFQL